MIDSAMFGYSSYGGTSARDAASAATEARAAGRNVQQIEERLERLSLVCMAMWSLIQDKTSLTEADLLERVRVIDLMDGDADGKASRTVSKCTKCQRVMSPRHQKCLYCGAERLVQSAFDAV